MAKKLKRCCFCNKSLIGQELWGAYNESTDKNLCLECVTNLYEMLVDAISQHKMDDSVKEEKLGANPYYEDKLGTNTHYEADGVPTLSGVQRGK